MKIFHIQKYFTAGLSALLLLPFAPIVLWSFANQWQYPRAWPQIFGAQGWRTFLITGGVPAVVHSILIGVLVTVVVVPLSFMAAKVITQLEGWPVRVFEGILFLPVFLPPFVLVMGVTTGSIAINMPADMAVIATLSVLAMPYATFIFRSSFLSYGSAWEEEGELLGAHGIQLLIRVRIPMLYNSILAATLIAFLIGWSDYIVTLTVGGGQVLSLPLLIGSSASAPGNDSALAAMSTVSIVIPVLIAIVIRVITKKRNEVR